MLSNKTINIESEDRSLRDRTKSAETGRVQGLRYTGKVEHFPRKALGQDNQTQFLKIDSI